MTDYTYDKYDMDHSWQKGYEQGFSEGIEKGWNDCLEYQKKWARKESGSEKEKDRS